MLKRGLLAAAMAVSALVAAAPASAGPVMDAIRARGVLNCGINTGVAGFALPDSRGEWQGLDVDLCHTVVRTYIPRPVVLYYCAYVIHRATQDMTSTHP